MVTAITVPLGVAFALGVDRWRGRLPEGANIVMLFSFVIPETLLAVALLFLVTQIVDPADPRHLRAGRRAGDLPAVLPRDHRAGPLA